MKTKKNMTSFFVITLFLNEKYWPDIFFELIEKKKMKEKDQQS